MKNLTTLITLALFLALMTGVASAQETDPVEGAGNGLGNGNGVCQFVDEDGDGFNDLAPDADGDGIPNGLDPDYVRPQDGTGNQNGMFSRLFDNSLTKAFGEGSLEGHNGPGYGNGYGPGDGTGGSSPADGTGFGPGNGTGECDPEGDGTSTQQQDRRGRR